jgi:hypothetical protein
MFEKELFSFLTIVRIKKNFCLSFKTAFFPEKCLKKKYSVRFVTNDASEWHVPTSIDQLIDILDKLPETKTSRIVGGNTGRGGLNIKVNNHNNK